MFDFEQQLKTLPQKPGVYIMKNDLGEVIYVGKAKILKNRVRQYFQNSKNHSEKVRAMVRHIAEFEYIVTDNEMEALLLECNLIKKYSPKYNIALKDDKFYPFIKITTNEDFPRVFVTRNYAKDGNKYFGPYTSGGAVYEVINLINKLYPLRQSKRNIKEEGPFMRPCLNYQLKKCLAPCAGYISKLEYGKMIEEVINILSGKDSSLKNKLKKSMEEASENLEFEEAAKLRDKILAIETIKEKQKMFTAKDGDEDYIDLYSDNSSSSIQIFFVRDGKVTGREHFMIDNNMDSSKGTLIGEFITRFYGGTATIPKNIYVPEIEDLDLLEEFLTLKKGSKVWIKIPKIGEKKEMLTMVRNNAKVTLEKFKDKIVKDKESNKIVLEELAENLNLETLPYRIEAYDISNIQGVDSVGTMVVFEEGKSKNSDYRRFKIKTVNGPDDYSSMREILERRFSRGLEEIEKIQHSELNLSKGKFCVFPDLIMMDGGKGQVNIALEVLKKFNINIPVCGLVKDDSHNTRGIIFNNEEIILNKRSKAMALITRIQDEVHRFSITYHRSLRDKRTLHSILDDIPGVGEKRKKALLIKFGSVEKIKNATVEELLETPSIDRNTAENIRNYFNNKNKP
ncbi:excinuclease ABC subunit UvrC [Clostridium massiliamazoniense]|uniref:excinuclease ABC subunit UvrC n=1 Tax=Clostridium massiliamazoniense TaxID=1347366 RepID=UPI0006D84A21|nr:excinuclease ABC subunit UvrC [Clostridium massiliamazoniense]